MPASYPTSPKTFASRSSGQTIAPSHMNDLQDEVASVESALLTGLQHRLGLYNVALADVPTPSMAGSLVRRSDGPRGFLVDTGAVWADLTGGYVDVKRDYHATGDGVTDDTAAIQAAIDATPACGRLHFPPGLYKISAALERTTDDSSVFDACIHITGCGRSSVIMQTADADAFFFWCTEDPNAHVQGWSMRDIMITYTAGRTSGSALRLRHWHRGHVRNVFVGGAGTAALRLEQCICNTFVNYCSNSGFTVSGFTATRPEYGLIIQDYLGVASNANVFFGGEFHLAIRAPGYGVYLDGTGRGNRLYGTTIQSNTVGVVIGSSHVDYLFEGTWLESNTTDYSIGTGQGLFRPVGDIELRMACTYRAKGRRTTNQAIGTGSGTDISFDTNDFNVGYSGNIHNTATQPTRFVAPVDGTYEFKATVQWEANATGYRNLTVVKNGAAAVPGGLSQVVPVTGAETIVSVAVDVVLAKDDYLTVQVLQNSGGNLNVAAGSVASMRWVAEPFTT
jgi:hypothetical protein